VDSLAIQLVKVTSNKLYASGFFGLIVINWFPHHFANINFMFGKGTKVISR
jgi:hypothetical protein